MNIDVHAHIIPANLMKSKLLSPEIEEIGAGVYSYVIWGNRIRPAYAALTDENEHLAYMDAQGIDVEVLSTSPYLFGYDKDPAFGRELTRAFNDELADICKKHPDRFIGLGSVPLQDTPSAVEELKYCVTKLGFAGVELCSHVCEEDLDEDRFADFFAAANELGCSILIHPHNIPPRKRLTKYYTANLIGNPIETTLTASRMLLSGFFNKYPKLRVCFAHGGGAFPYVYSRIKNGFAVRPEIKSDILPTVDLPDNMYFDSIVFEEKTFRFMIDAVGLDRVVLGTDYPFDMRLDEPVKTIKNWCSEQEAKKVLTENANRFLGRP